MAHSSSHKKDNSTESDFTITSLPQAGEQQSLVHTQPETTFQVLHRGKPVHYCPVDTHGLLKPELLVPERKQII